MPYEVGLAAFFAIRTAGLLDGSMEPTSLDLLEVLSQPLQVEGEMRRYRFPRQRAERVAGALDFIGTSEFVGDPRTIRDWLLEAPGIGPKTASWVVRNYFGAETVAILDVHLVRAAIQAGIFAASASVARQYSALESLFLAWAHAGSVSAADLDAVIWRESAAGARSR